MPLKYRILTIVGLSLLSLFFLFPRNVTTRERGADGLMHDVTQRHVPLQLGLDLKGGTYLALEVDDSKQPIPADTKADAIERALKVVRSRVEGTGVSEAVVQKQGTDRIVVQIPGEEDPERAKKLFSQMAVLEFKITDKSQALERALPKLDQVVKQRGLAAVSRASRGAGHSGEQGIAGIAQRGHEQEIRQRGEKGCDRLVGQEATRRRRRRLAQGPFRWRVLEHHRAGADAG